MIKKLTILNVEFNRRSIRSLCHPHVKILTFTYFEKDTVVTVIQIGKFI